jgi:hypothetical protein
LVPGRLVPTSFDPAENLFVRQGYARRVDPAISPF